jgi:PAS domain-containing protein
MDDKDKTKGELIIELRELRTQIKTVEASKIKLRRAKAEIQEARRYAENIVETVREPLLVLDGDLKIISANRSFYRTFKVTPSNTKQHPGKTCL